ncbi:MAG: FAD-dependent monooxygenase [Rhodospirillales bacterium]|nr:FAD-dependent monooxygenase [Rhodospirillales bacterium]
MAQQVDVDVLISGGGVAGLTLAALLGRAGLSVTLIDKGPAPEPLGRVRPTGRTVALMRSSIALLERTGAWARCAGQGGFLRTMRLIDDSRAGFLPPRRVEFHAQEIGLDYFSVNMPNAPLRAALAEAVQTLPGVRFLSGTGLKDFSVQPLGVQVQLDSGASVFARLLIGADGGRSAVRAGAGITAREHTYGQNAITCLIAHDKPHEDTSTEFHRPSGPFAIVPLPGRTSSIVWVEPEDRAAEILKLDREDFTRALARKTGGILGEICLETAPESWPLRRLRAHCLTAPRVALIAEAAHVMSPITAQGLNLSLRDVGVLADTLIGSARAGMDIGSRAVLDIYENARLRDVRTRVVGTDVLNRLVSNNKTVFWLARQAGYAALDVCGPLRRLAIRQGLAPPVR